MVHPPSHLRLCFAVLALCFSVSVGGLPSRLVAQELAGAQEAENPLRALLQSLEAGGVAEETRAGFIASLGAASERESLTPLLPWLSDSSEVLGLVCGVTMMSVSPEEAERALVRHIRRAHGRAAHLLPVLGMSRQRGTIDFLIGVLRSPLARERELAMTALQIRTGQLFLAPEKWRLWWRTLHRAFARPPIQDAAEFAERLTMVTAGRKAREARDRIAALGQTGPTGAVAWGFDTVAKGAAMRCSDATKRAIALFTAGKLAEARRAYAQALAEDHFDRIARLDLAFLELEAGAFDAAAAHFAQLQEYLRDSVLLADLEQFARAQRPAAELLDALTAAEAARTRPRGSSLASDSLIEFLIRRAFSTARFPVAERAAEVLTRSGSEFLLDYGAALAANTPLARQAALRWSARFPDLPEAQAAAALQLGFGSQPDRAAAEIACQRWAVIEPDNAAPRLVSFALKTAAKRTTPSTRVPYTLEELDELDAALRFPAARFHREARTKAIARFAAETGFPFPGFFSTTEFSTLGVLNALNTGLGTRQRPKTTVIPRPEHAERLRQVCASLARVFPESDFEDPILKSCARIFAGLEKAWAIRAVPADAAESDTIAPDDVDAAFNYSSRGRDLEFPIRDLFVVLPSPSLHRALKR